MSDQLSLTREQTHALYTVREHPVLTASELAHFYNTECFGDYYDDVAETTPGGLATRLAWLAQRGLVRSEKWDHRVTIWDTTLKGLQALEAALVSDPESGADQSLEVPR